MFVLFIVGEPMTGQHMFQSDEEEGADRQVSALPILFYCILFVFDEVILPLQCTIIFLICKCSYLLYVVPE
jgi:hypothetical protein